MKTLVLIFSFLFSSIAFGTEPDFAIFQKSIKQPSFTIFGQLKFHEYGKDVVDLAKKSNKPLLLFLDCEPREVKGFITSYGDSNKLKKTEEKNKILISYYLNGEFCYVPVDKNTSDEQIISIYQELTKPKQNKVVNIYKYDPLCPPGSTT